MTEAKIRHLEMIRNAIDGAAGNSLRIKGFAMLLLAGALALLLRDSSGGGTIPLPMAVILWLIIIILGVLDLYFIRQADLFRILYNHVQTLSDDGVDFSMELEGYSAELERQYGEHPSFQLWASVFLYLNIFLIVLAGTLPLLAI